MDQRRFSEWCCGINSEIDQLAKQTLALISIAMRLFTQQAKINSNFYFHTKNKNRMYPKRTKPFTVNRKKITSSDYYEKNKRFSSYNKTSSSFQ